LAAINKKRFLYTYLNSSKTRITSKNIISSFKKTSIWLFNFKIVLDNLEIIIKNEILSITPFKASTPTYIILNKLGDFISIFQTPQKSKNFYRQL